MDRLKKQDGIAPQCPAGNMQFNRAYIPNDVEQDFLNSHYIKNYHWIFNITNPNLPGYVKPKN